MTTTTTSATNVVPTAAVQVCKNIGPKFGLDPNMITPSTEYRDRVAYEWMRRQKRKKEHLLYIYVIVFIFLSVLTVISIIIRNRDYYDNNSKKFWYEVLVYVCVAVAVYVFIILSRGSLSWSLMDLQRVGMIMVFAFIVSILMEFSGANSLLAGDLGEEDLSSLDPACQFKPRSTPTRQNFAKNLVFYCGYTLISLTVLLVVYVTLRSIFYVKSGSFYSYFAGSGLAGDKLYAAITIRFLLEALIVSFMCAAPLTYVAVNRKKHAQISTNITKDKPVMKYFGVFVSIVFLSYIVLQFAGAFDSFNNGYCRSVNDRNIVGRFPDLPSLDNLQVRKALCRKYKCNQQAKGQDSVFGKIVQFLSTY